MRFSYILALVASLASATVLPRQSSAASSVYKLSGNAWIETVAVRSNGDILLARLDVPELWSVNPSTKAGSKLLSFTGGIALTGLTELSPDVFAVVVGNITVRGAISVKAGSWAVWKVDLTGSSPKANLVKAVPESGFFIGVTPFNNDTIFIADAGKGAVVKIKISTGEYSTVLADPTMKAPSSAAIQEGIHGIQYHDGQLFFTNTFGNSYNKIAVDKTTGKVGAVTPIKTAMSSPEGFTLGPDGTAYMAQMSGGVIKITSDGKQSSVASVSSASCAAFGRTDKDKNTLYVSTSNGALMSVNVS